MAMIETVYTDDDLRRAHNAEQPTDTDDAPPTYNKAVMKLFRRAKKAGKKNDIRSRKIVEELRLEREQNLGVVEHAPKQAQRTLVDF